MTTLLQQFIDELQLRGHSPRTIDGYVRAIRLLQEHFQRPPDQVTDSELRQYLLYLLRERHYAARTMVVALCGLRQFYARILHRSTEAMDAILPHMKVPVTRPRIYSPQEVERLVSAPGLSPRDRSLLMTTYAAGLRVSEVCHLKVSDIISARMQIRVEQGKGPKDRYTILSPGLLQVLRDYWRLYRPKSWLFPSPDFPDRPIRSRTAERIFIKAVGIAQLPNHDGIHSLRHSFATHLLEMGVDVITLQRLLGHTSLATTAAYLHLRADRFLQIKGPLDLISIPSLQPKS